MNLVEKILAGDVRATARLLRDIDDCMPSARSILARLHPHTGRAHVIGFTGSPGVGKSTLVDQLTSRFRKDALSVGILAVDPTSPFTGGAILGDRIRMQRHFLDSSVFIRSIATRGHFGGLTKSTQDMISVFDAMGKEVVMVETVGVGQDEVEIVECAHTTIVATVPGMGDEVQAIKAGIMEIGDIFVVNKSDREGARKSVKELRNLIELGSRSREASGWEPPIIETVASRGQGIEELRQAILDHKQYLLADSGLRFEDSLKKRARSLLLAALKDEILKTLLERLEARGSSIEALVERIAAREVDPYSAVAEVLACCMPEIGPRGQA
jgi:LAO/AO transport system kinase